MFSACLFSQFPYPMPQLSTQNTGYNDSFPVLRAMCATLRKINFQTAVRQLIFQVCVTNQRSFAIRTDFLRIDVFLASTYGYIACWYSIIGQLMKYLCVIGNAIQAREYNQVAVGATSLNALTLNAFRHSAHQHTFMVSCILISSC